MGGFLGAHLGRMRRAGCFQAQEDYEIPSTQREPSKRGEAPRRAGGGTAFAAESERVCDGHLAEPREDHDRPEGKDWGRPKR